MKINISLPKFETKLLNLPYFVFRKSRNFEFGFIGKLYFLINSYLITYLFKFFNEKSFCKIMNLFYKNDGKIYWDQDKLLFFKNYKNNIIYFPDKFRIAGSMVNHQYELNNLLDSYCLNKFEINPNDTVVDCGANVGMFYLALKQFEKKFNYYAYEPDANVFKCLELNLKNCDNIKLFKKGLSSRNGNASFYINSSSGDSSVEKFNSTQVDTIELVRLDNENHQNIKLLKIDAEGHELEVLVGASNLLNKIEFICVDMGSEKGEAKENTATSVINFLYSNNFTLVEFNPNRTTGLFKNNALL